MLTAEERLDILDLIVRADDCATQRDAEAYVALFTMDAVMDGSEGSYSGKSALKEAVGKVWRGEPKGTHHVSTGLSLQEDPATGLIVVYSSLLLVAHDPAALLNIATVRQEVRRDGSRWRISRRTIN